MGWEFFVPTRTLIAVKLLNSCGWAYGSTFTPIPPQRFPPDLGEFTEILDDVNAEMIPVCYG